MLNLPLLVVILFQLRLTNHGPLPGVIGIVPQVSSHLAAVQLHYLAHHTVKKIAVMGHNHHCPLIIHQKSLQPGNGADVQMIRRLIQKDHIRLRHQ